MATNPTLIVVSGASGFGKAAPNDLLTRRSSDLFFELVEVVVRGGATAVAEAAFQHDRWSHFLKRLEGMARIVIVQCHADPAVALQRMRVRGARAAHGDAEFLATVKPDYITRFARRPPSKT